ncbi:disease resistance protein RFL1-like [Prosopis cineraria]|uniref:disease resistance protein RFL1-like n=1 Tax=Prosopis cineraria TaxID=364024 RepID=UPI0024100725|nr:disease resistance protein RFL1-like [Prosopis cineraria]
MSSYKLGKIVAKMLKDVDEMATEGKGYSKDFPVVYKVPTNAIEIPLNETVGLDLMFDKVWNSIEVENVGVIGLYGIGGVGKTTLLKKLNNELENRRLDFDVVMWVVVSKEPNLDSIMDNIRKLVGIKDDIWKTCCNPREKVARIYRVLKQKKFSLLLDDIWDTLDLKLVGVPHPKDTKCQSKILFTTRSEDVCAKMQAERTFKVETLTEEEASKLFCMKVGEETLRSNPHIPKLTEKMAKECKRLLLALIVIGSAMAGVKSMEAWEHSINNLTSSSLTAPNLEVKVFSVLKFSYDQLDKVHKSCFLYCASYPEDCEIMVLNLINKWTWEKFLCNAMRKSVQDMRGYGETVFEKLKLSCLLEGIENDLFMTHDQDIEYMKKRWRVLDVIVREERIFVEIGGLVSLECLTLLMIDIPREEYFMKLRYLKNIKFLSLRVLDVLEWNIPLGVSLPNIEEVWIGIRSLDGRHKLFKSIKLQSCIYNLSIDCTYLQNLASLLACMSKMKHLQEIKLYSLDCIGSTEYSFVIDTCCLNKLRSVTICACQGVTHATWLKHAPLLQELSIQGCRSMEEVIKEEAATKDENIEDSSLFFSLVTLTLEGLPSIKSIHKATLPFPSLKSIRIYDCPELKKLPLDSNSAKLKLTLIQGPESWWNNLEWDDHAAKQIFQSKFKAYLASEFLVRCRCIITSSAFHYFSSLVWLSFSTQK